MNLYPLRFQPIWRQYIWGGRRLETALGKPLPGDGVFAESWEIVDHGEDQSVVAFGDLVGTSLAELIELDPAAMLGEGATTGPFPLLLKFLDANKPLSVQVHPNDEQAARLDPPDLGKTEAWVILHAEPGAKIYAGLKRGFDRPALEREVARGTTNLCLHQFEPATGDCVFIPAGTVHALGAGLVVAEIQQSSDTTYRLFDWNRVGADGQPRQLHIEAGLDAIDYDRGPVAPQVPQPTTQADVERLVECDKFILDRRRLTEPQTIGGDGWFHVLAVIDGSIDMSDDPSGQPLTKGQSALIPAAVGPVRLTPGGETTLIHAYLPPTLD